MTVIEWLCLVSLLHAASWGGWCFILSLDMQYTAIFLAFLVDQRRASFEPIPALTQSQYESMNHLPAPLLVTHGPLDGLYTLLTFEGNVKRTVA